MGGRGSSSYGSSRMASLRGSEKQVAWASNIRKDSIEGLQALKKVAIANSKKMGESPSVRKDGEKRFDTMIKALKEETSARSFIDTLSTVSYPKEVIKRGEAVMSAAVRAARSGSYENDLEKKLASVFKKN